jgi:hypothetical protein
MTPSQWDRSEDARELLDYAAPRIPRQLLVLASVACARTAERYLDDRTRGPALAALAMTEAWVWGRATIDEVRAAADAAAATAAATAAAYAAAAANAAAYATATAAAAAAANAAAYAAAYAAAAYAAVWSAAQDAKLAELAILVRRIIPHPKVKRVEWPSRWYDADHYLEGMLIEVPIETGLELVLFRVDGHVVETATAKEVITGELSGRMPMAAVAMDAAQETR